MDLNKRLRAAHLAPAYFTLCLLLQQAIAQSDSNSALHRPRLGIDAAAYLQPSSDMENYGQLAEEVHSLMQIAPKCAEFQYLHTTLLQVMDSIRGPLDQRQRVYVSSLESSSSFTVRNSAPPMDLKAMQPDQMRRHIAAIQRRAALAGTGPPEWALGARCKALLPPNDTWEDVIIRNVTALGQCMVETISSVNHTDTEQPATSTGAFAEVRLWDLTLVSSVAGAFWTPMPPPAYDPTLPAHPTYSDEEKEAQRDAAATQQSALKAAIEAGNTSYTFPAGVYRLKTKVEVWKATNFTLNMVNVELIAEDNSGHFNILNSTGTIVRGPLALDADPCGVSQSVIVSSDNSTSVVVQVMPGYADPNTKGRVLLFDSQGKRLPGGQAEPTSVTGLGNSRFALEFKEVDMDLGIRAAAKPGNYIVHEGFQDGVALRANRGVTFQHVNAYAAGAVWGQGELGLDSFTHWRSMRRPGTNRLYAGGSFFQIEFEGGSFDMDRSEVAYNWDDLTDLYGAMGWSTSNGQTADTIWASTGDWQPGQDMVVYNGYTLQLEGRAKIVSVDENLQNDTSLQALNDAFTQAGMRTIHDSSMRLIRLDQPIQISNLSMLECEQFRPQKISITNSYLHDGLNMGINAKGSNETVFANNWVQRTANSGIGVGEDRWWWEGPMPDTVRLVANTVQDSCYQDGSDNCDSIAVYAKGAEEDPKGRPISRVEALGNRIAKPSAGDSISIGQTKTVRTWGNLPLVT